MKNNRPDQHTACPFSQTHIGIVTIIPEVEKRSMLRALDYDDSTQAHQINDQDYWFITLPSQDKTLNIAVTVANDQRNAEAQHATSEMITICNPNILILVGIAAGVRGKTELGDVVISETIMYYEPAKLKKDGTERRGGINKPDESVLRVLRSFYKSDYTRRWHTIFDSLQRRLTRDELPEPPPMLKPSCQFKFIATGEKILADGSLKKLHDEIHDNIRAGETESWGFLTAAIKGRKSWFVIRGISDFGDMESKDGSLKDKYHHSAANAASSITRTFLESEFVWKMINASSAEIQKQPKVEIKTRIARKEVVSPWTLNGRAIQLKNLSNARFWVSLADKGNKLLRIIFVLPSGKFQGSIAQLPLVSDAMYLPEIAADIVYLMQKTSYRVEIQVLFDIDIVDWDGREYHLRTDLIKDSNLFLTATGDVNLATRLIYQKFTNLCPGPETPGSPQLVGISKSYPEVIHPDLGLLSVCRSPLNDRRIIILCCGTLAVGTIGTQLLLQMYIRGKAKNLGNNNNDENVSVKIVDFPVKTYQLPLLQYNETVPKMQLLNVDIKSVLKGNGVLE